MKYTKKSDSKKSAKTYGRNLRISTKSSVTICRAITGLRLKKAEALLDGMAKGKRDIHGKYYTKTVGGVLELLGSARNNADAKGMEPDNMVVHASAHKGFRLWTPRRFKLRRRQAKNTNIQVVLEAR